MPSQTTLLRDILLGAAFSLIATSTFADEAAVPPILRGTIAKIDTTWTSISKADGTSTAVALAPGASFSTVVRRDFGQIKATDFIGVTGEPGPDGKLRPLEIQAGRVHGLPVTHLAGAPRRSEAADRGGQQRCSSDHQAPSSPWWKSRVT